MSDAVDPQEQPGQPTESMPEQPSVSDRATSATTGDGDSPTMKALDENGKSGRFPRFEPANSYIRDGVRRSFGDTRRDAGGLVEFDLVVIEVKSLVKPEAGIQNKGRNECTGLVALLFEYLRQGDLRSIKDVISIVAHTVVWWVKSREDCGVRR